MISYAGVPLVVPDPKIVARVNEAISLGDIYLQAAPDLTLLSPGWQIPDYAHDVPQKLGRLIWPVGASQWAIGRFMATESQLDRIRQQVYTGDSRGITSAPLIIDDGQNKITTNMYLRPPRPLHQWSDGQSLYLIELVDDRFYWWWRSAAIPVTVGMQWGDLINAIGSALSGQNAVAINFLPIDSRFLNPSPQLFNHYDYLPLQLDTIAYSLGRRLVRKLDGTIILQTTDQEVTQAAMLRKLWSAQVNFGGSYNFDINKPHCDLVAQVPASILMRFQADSITGLADPDNFTLTQNLADLDLAQYMGKTVTSGTKTVHTRARAFMMGGMAINQTQLANLLAAWSTEWWRWQLSHDAVVYSGIVPWDGDGGLDFVEWAAYHQDGTSTVIEDMRTWVSREPLNDMAMELFHGNDGINAAYSGSGYASACIDHFGDVDLLDIPDWDPNGPPLYIFGDQDGCAVKVGTTQCPGSGS